MEWVFRVFLLLVLLQAGTFAKVCPSGQEPRRVLFLQSYHLSQPMEDGFVAGMRQQIDSAGLWVEFHFEYMDGKRFPPPKLDTLLDTLLVRKYSQFCFDALVVADNIALDYVLARRDGLFAGIPLVFLGVNNFSDEMVAGQKNLTGIVEDNDLPGTLDLIHALQPDLKDLYLVTDLTETGGRLRQIAEQHMKSDKRWNVHWLQDETYASLLDSLADPRGKGAALLLTYSVDREGTLYSEMKFLGMMGEKTRKPLYVMIEHQMQEGIVGGALLSGREHGRIAGNMVLDILQGKPADSIPILRKSPKLNYVDYPALLRFGIDPKRVPPGTEMGRVPFSPWVHYRTAILAVGSVILFLLVSIAVLLRMRAQLRVSREQYRDLVDHANTMILRRDSKGRIQFINEFGERLLGYSLAELKNRDVVGTFVPEVDSNGLSMREMMGKMLESPEAFEDVEVESISKDGRRLWVHWFNRPQFNARGKLKSIFSVGSDVTEKHLRDEDLQRFNRKVAHDLRTPLVTINSFAGMLLEDIEAGDKDAVAQDVKYIQHSAGRMEQQVEELTHLFRVGAARQVQTRFPVADAVDEARMVVAGRLKERQIAVDIKANGWLTGDRSRFVDIMQNLMDNAAKHMGEQIEPLIEVGTKVRDGKPLLYVRDNGEGIPASDLEKIFEAFVKLDSHVEGSGLGLSLVRRMVDTHGGRIWAESEGLGHGTTFWLMLDHLELPSVG